MPIDRSIVTKKDIEAGYDAVAAKMFVSTDFYNEVLDTAEIFSGDILEVGVGQGPVLELIKKRGGNAIKSLTGLDLSDKLLAMARVRLPEVQLVKGDAEAMPFEDKSFDMVVMVDVFQYLLDFNKALEEVKRVLRPGGKFLVSVPNKKWILFKSYIVKRKNIQPVEDHFFDFQEMKNLLRTNGFNIVRMRGADALRFYGRRHKVEKLVAVIFPFLNRYMKKMVFVSTV